MRSREDRLLFGHLWAAGAASSLLFILLFGKGVVSELMHLSFSPRLFLGVLTLLPAFFIFWLMVAACTWFTGTIPLVIAFLIAEKFRVQNVWYYLLSGVLIGIVATPVFVMVAWSHFGSLSFFERCIEAAPLVVPCSVFGCFVYWWKAGRWSGVTAMNS